MITFLFWNIKNNPIQSIIARLALRHEVDVIMLAECDIAPYILLSELNSYNCDTYKYIQSIGCDRIKIFVRFSEEYIPAVMEEDKFTIRHLSLPKAQVDIILSIAHLPSKNRKGNLDQFRICQRFSASIRDAEKDIGHSKTIRVGDLNISPFDDGVVAASGLNGTMSWYIAQRINRIVDGEDYPFFYNPMWNFLGDFKSSSPGTYYYNKSGEN